VRRGRLQESRRLKRAPSRLRLVADAPAPLIDVLIRQGGITTEAAREAIERGGAFVRGRRSRDLQTLVARGDKIEVSLRAPPRVELAREALLHLDGELIAIDKPAGIAAQEELAGGPSLPDLCASLLQRLGEKQTQALLVHRLDKGTTGVTLLARTKAAQARLLEEFRERRVHKEYRALALRAPDAERIEAPVDGKPAVTRVHLVEQFALAAHVAAFPETGRTHQVRIHLQPLLGDRQHGGPMFLSKPDGARIDFDRPMLHARALELGKLRVEAKLPADFERALDWLR
jgi:23S rRNA pseudouridine1911/1915/1917 synthase